MSKNSVARELKAIFNNDSLSGSKKLTEAGNVIKNTTKDYAQTVNTKTAQLNVSKWGLTAAATGIGAGVGIGVGSQIASAGISNAFGLDFSNEEKKTESTKKATGWIIALVIGGVCLYLFLPKIKKWVNKK